MPPKPKPGLRPPRHPLDLDDALAPPADRGEVVLQVPMGSVTPSPDNPRHDVGDVDELAESIRALGIIEPLIVRPAPAGAAGYEGVEGTTLLRPVQRWVLIAGERRWTAAGKAGLTQVPVIVRELDDRQALAVALVENCHRRDLSPVEEAGAYQRLIAEFGYSQRELAKAVGRSQAHISKRLALLELPAATQAAVDSGGITVADALELSKLVATPERLVAAQQNVTPYRNVQQAVSQQLQELEAEQRLAAAVASAKASRVPYVEWPEGGSWTAATPYCMLGWLTPPLREEEHFQEPCHAVSVRPWDAACIGVCTDPGRHAAAGTGAEPEEEAARQAAAQAMREQEDALDAAGEVRRAFVLELLSRSLPKADVAAHVGRMLAAMVGDVSWETYEIAGSFLELEDRGEDLVTVFDDYADRGPDEATRVGLALVLAAAEEESMPSGRSRTWHSSAAAHHLAFLERHGYTITPPERAKLAEGRAALEELLREEEA